VSDCEACFGRDLRVVMVGIEQWESGEVGDGACSWMQEMQAVNAMNYIRCILGML
jgi:hypothetical protein